MELRKKMAFAMAYATWF